MILLGVPSYFYETIGYSSEGHVPLKKYYMVAFDDKVICVITNTLSELNECLCKFYEDQFEQGFAIIDITEVAYKMKTDREYLGNYISMLKDVIPSLQVKIE